MNDRILDAGDGRYKGRRHLYLFLRRRLEGEPDRLNTCVAGLLLICSSFDIIGEAFIFVQREGAQREELVINPDA